jgi:hypothetical protein
MREKFIKFMEGRYGVDAFARFTMGVAFVMIILSMFIRSRVGAAFDTIGLLAILITECFPEIYRSVMPKTRNICPLHLA